MHLVSLYIAPDRSEVPPAPRIDQSLMFRGRTPKRGVHHSRLLRLPQLTAGCCARSLLLIVHSLERLILLTSLSLFMRVPLLFYFPIITIIMQNNHHHQPGS